MLCVYLYILCSRHTLLCLTFFPILGYGLSVSLFKLLQISKIFPINLLKKKFVYKWTCNSSNAVLFKG